jgi:hypothetical protein
MMRNAQSNEPLIPARHFSRRLITSRPLNNLFKLNTWDAPRDPLVLALDLSKGHFLLKTGFTATQAQVIRQRRGIS